VRVLINEDNRMDREILVGLLSPYAKCETAVNGAMGIQLFNNSHTRGKPYDLICMDIRMPNMNGQEALKEIRKIEKEMGIGRKDRVKVIMITVVTDKKNVLEAIYHGGAVRYVVKPIDKDALLKAIRDVGLLKKTIKSE